MLIFNCISWSVFKYLSSHVFYNTAEFLLLIYVNDSEEPLNVSGGMWLSTFIYISYCS